jgi:hypothetical protein
MTDITTELITNAVLSYTREEEGWRAYLAEGGYSESERATLIDALMAAVVADFDAMLPDGCHWVPSTSSIVGPVGTDLGGYDIAEMLRSAGDEVAERRPQIEQAVLGS